MRGVALGKFRWRVRNMWAYMFWFLLGSLGAHRFYVGRWSTGLAFFIFTIGSTLIEIFILEPMTNITWDTKENISIGITVLIWIFLLRDLFLIRKFVDEVNEPAVSEIFE